MVWWLGCLYHGTDGEGAMAQLRNVFYILHIILTSRLVSFNINDLT